MEMGLIEVFFEFILVFFNFSTLFLELLTHYCV